MGVLTLSTGVTTPQIQEIGEWVGGLGPGFFFSFGPWGVGGMGLGGRLMGVLAFFWPFFSARSAEFVLTPKLTPKIGWPGHPPPLGSGGTPGQ